MIMPIRTDSGLLRMQNRRIVPCGAREGVIFLNVSGAA